MKKLVLGFSFLILLAGLATTVGRAQDWPLTQDDIKILLIGGAKPEKMIEMIKRRGVDFQMNPDLAKKFHDEGATDEVIEALQRATVKHASNTAASAARAAAPAAPSTRSPAAAPNPPPSVPAKAAKPAATGQPHSSVQEKINQARAEKTPVVDETGSETGDAPSAPAASAPEVKKVAPAPVPLDLRDPNPIEIQRIIQEFAAKEKLFKQARDNYAYHQINKVDELGPNNEVIGTFRQDWDILYDDSGKRIEQVTYAPLTTLRNVIMTEEDMNSFRSIQPFVLTTDDLPEYEIKYLGHVKVDLITAYVFKVRPKEIKKGRQYFDGIVWVDDRDLQVVKSEGKPVPELKNKNGDNLFPRFTTYREQIDGKFWFPTYTAADDTLYFPGNPVHLKEIIRYTNYKQFKAASTIKIINVVDEDKPKAPSKPDPNPPKQ